MNPHISLRIWLLLLLSGLVTACPDGHKDTPEEVHDSFADVLAEINPADIPGDPDLTGEDTVPPLDLVPEFVPDDTVEDLTEDEESDVTETPDPCLGENCGGHGVCVDSGGVAICLCEEGYYALGRTCVFDAPDSECVEIEMPDGDTFCLSSETPYDDMTGFPADKELMTRDLPVKVSHKEEYLEEWCPNTTDQKKCNWCTAHATSQAMEALICKDHLEMEPYLSEPHMWWAGGRNTAGCKNGWSITAPMAAAKSTYIAYEDVWPYSGANNIPSEFSIDDIGEETLVAAGQYRITDLAGVPKGDIAALRAALAAGYNVNYSIPVIYPAWWNKWDIHFAPATPAEIESGAAPLCKPTDHHREHCTCYCEKDADCKFGMCRGGRCIAGYHAILFTGYEDPTEEDPHGWFEFRNSWANKWGKGGYGRLSYEAVAVFGRGGAYATGIVAIENCIPDSYQKCMNGEIWSFDTCDVPTHIAKTCDNSCIPGESECSQACECNDVTWCCDGCDYKEAGEFCGVACRVCDGQGSCSQLVEDGAECVVHTPVEFTGQCLEGECACVPDCGDKQCGNDGCGGSCGDDCLCGCSEAGLCEACEGCGDVDSLTVPGLNIGTTLDGVNRFEAYSCSGISATLDGGEKVYHYQVVEDQAVVLIKIGGSWDQTIVVLEGECEPQECVAFGLSSVAFTAQGGRDYYVIVDSPAGEETAFQILAQSVSCTPSCDGKECGSDGCIGECGTCECGCSAEGQCLECSPCEVLESIACGDIKTGDTFDSEAMFSEYECIDGGTKKGYGGREVAYSFMVEEETTVYPKLNKGDTFVDVFVLEGSCLPDRCVVVTPVFPGFVAQPGVEYFVMVDALEGLDAVYELELECTGCIPDCTGKICGDDGCGGSCGDDCLCGCAEGQCGACPTCQEDKVVTCGESLTGTTAELVSDIDAYSCQPTWLELGGELVYSFTPDQDDEVTFTVTSKSGAVHDVFLLAGECAADQCAKNLTGKAFAVTAGVNYFLAVDSYADKAGAFSLTVACAGDTPDSSCEGHCGGKADECYCDANCLTSGDCCDDICEHCPDLEQCCVPDCEFKNCGEDGCGGSCGECDDKDVCNGSEECFGGECGPQDPPLDCDDTLDCTMDTCDPITGCVYTPDDAACEDDNLCTDDSCDLAGGCIHTNNALPCDDANACTIGDTCADGACLPGDAVVCDDGIDCTVDSCHTATGCVYTPDDAVCDDDNLCTDDSCDPATGCVNANNTIACDDADACTTGDICADGACVPGDALICDDGVDCTADSCDAATGCVFAPEDAECDDANPCTDDACDLVTGCVIINNTLSCDDTLLCTNDDVCLEGVCSGIVNDCDDENPCTDDSCEEGVGCQYVNNNVSCDDGNGCTGSDTCADGVCLGEDICIGFPIINEVDYDQTGGDTLEFVELYNATDAPIVLAAYKVELVNGNGDVIYDTFELADAGELLPAGDYLVIGSDALVATVPDGTLVISLGNGSIQNGDPDGVRVVRADDLLVDGLHYGGTMAGTGEGTSAPSDDGEGALGRCPDGTDTDQNQDDFVLTCVVTPGAANDCTPCSADASCLGNACVCNENFNGDGYTCEMEDGDEDGIADSLDNCPFTSNNDQLDFDNDGIGDACEADFDADGINDELDNCPNLPNQDQANGDWATLWTVTDFVDGPFVTPGDIEATPDGFVFAVDSSHRVFKFASDGTYLGWQGKDDDGFVGFHEPGSGKTAVVGTEPGAFDEPCCMYVDAGGLLHVLGYNDFRVQTFDSSFVYQSEWTHADLDRPGGIDEDNDGNIYVTATWEHKVLKFDSDHEKLLEWGGFNYPKGIGYRPTNDNIYVVDSHNHSLKYFSTDGVLTNEGQITNYPGPLAVDKTSGAVYTGVQTKNVQVWFGTMSSLKGTTDAGGVGVDMFGNVYVGDKNDKFIRKYGADGFGNACDNCPGVLNEDQIDTDEDGLGDACDPCPNYTGNDVDGDGICGNVDDCPLDADNDADSDGICGDIDNCPFFSNPDQEDSDEDGIGDVCVDCSAMTLVTHSSDSLNKAFRGIEFKVDQTVTVTAIGVEDGNGDGVLAGATQVGIFSVPVGSNKKTGTHVVSKLVPVDTQASANGAKGAFFVPIPPTELPPGNYFIAAECGTGVEPFAISANVTWAPGLSYVNSWVAQSTPSLGGNVVISVKSTVPGKWLTGVFKTTACE
jgi:hypothetical protein